jgi:hypothetical protein
MPRFDISGFIDPASPGLIAGLTLISGFFGGALASSAVGARQLYLTQFDYNARPAPSIHLNY